MPLLSKAFQRVDDVETKKSERWQQRKDMCMRNQKTSTKKRNKNFKVEAEDMFYDQEHHITSSIDEQRKR